MTETVKDYSLLLDDKVDSGSADVSSLQWEWVDCNLCGRDDVELYHRERLPYFGRAVDFEIVRCRNCGLVYTNPRLVDHNAVYLCGTVDDASSISSGATAKRAVFRSGLDQIIRLQSRSGGPKLRTLLDVGCGSGHFMASARRRGFVVFGIEPANIPAAYASREMGLKVFRRNVLDVDLPPESFDVITLWDVIEHLDDPRSTLLRCLEWLRPGGILALRFPSAGWQKAKAVIFHNLLGSARASFGPTMHLYFFDCRTFGRMAREVGLEILRTRTTANEPNTGSLLFNGIKIVSNMAVRAVELVSGRHLGNLEVYCRKSVDCD